MTELRVHSVHVAAGGEGRAVTQSVTRGPDEDASAFADRVVAMLEAMGVVALDRVDAPPAPRLDPALVCRDDACANLDLHHRTAGCPTDAAMSEASAAATMSTDRRFAPKTEQARRIVARLREAEGQKSHGEIASEFGVSRAAVAQLRNRWCPEVGTLKPAPVPRRPTVPQPTSSPVPAATPREVAPVTTSRRGEDDAGVCRDDKCVTVHLHRVGADCNRSGGARPGAGRRSA